MPPKISVITINYNNKDGLEKTIKSVVNQTYSDFEYIVIDGGSMDGSKNILEEHTDKITYWVSEQDKGIYNAMNKGVEASTGEYLLMLNSGDIFSNNTILTEVLKEKLDQDIVYGDVLWIEKDKSYIQDFPDNLTYSFFTVASRSIAHQSTFIRRELHYKYCFYDERFKIISDWAFFLIVICKYNATYKHINIPVSICDRDGISCNPDFFSLIAKEKDQFIKNEFPKFIEDYEQKKRLEDKIKYYEKLTVFQMMKIALKRSLRKMIK